MDVIDRWRIWCQNYIFLTIYIFRESNIFKMKRRSIDSTNRVFDDSISVQISDVEPLVYLVLPFFDPIENQMKGHEFQN